MLKYSRRHVDKSFNFTGAAETEILASLPVAPSGDDKNDKEEDPRMVTLIVTVDEEFLKKTGVEDGYSAHDIVNLQLFLVL